MSKETAPVSSSAPTLAPELVSVSNDTVTKESVMGILESMGVMDYDPAVLVALEEYGRSKSQYMQKKNKDITIYMY